MSALSNVSSPPDNDCGICFEALDSKDDKGNIIKPVVAHPGEHGIKHPLHVDCLKYYITVQKIFSVQCPYCPEMMNLDSLLTRTEKIEIQAKVFLEILEKPETKKLAAAVTIAAVVAGAIGGAALAGEAIGGAIGGAAATIASAVTIVRAARLVRVSAVTIVRAARLVRV